MRPFHLDGVGWNRFARGEFHGFFSLGFFVAVAERLAAIWNMEFYTGGGAVRLAR